MPIAPAFGHDVDEQTSQSFRTVPQTHSCRIHAAFCQVVGKIRHLVLAADVLAELVDVHLRMLQLQLRPQSLHKNLLVGSNVVHKVVEHRRFIVDVEFERNVVAVDDDIFELALMFLDFRSGPEGRHADQGGRVGGHRVVHEEAVHVNHRGHHNWFWQL